MLIIIVILIQIVFFIVMLIHENVAQLIRSFERLEKYILEGVNDIDISTLPIKKVSREKLYEIYCNIDFVILNRYKAEDMSKVSKSEMGHDRNYRYELI